MAGALISTTRAADGGVTVEVRGDVDVSSADRLRHVLTDTAALRPARIVVDLLHVTFIDSTGIGALIAGRNTALGLGIGFALRQPSAFVAGQLRQTGLYPAMVSDP